MRTSHRRHLRMPCPGWPSFDLFHFISILPPLTQTWAYSHCLLARNVLSSPLLPTSNFEGPAGSSTDLWLESILLFSGISKSLSMEAASSLQTFANSSTG